MGWLFPILWAVLTSFRSYEYTAANGYVSLGGWTVDNYVTAWRTAEFGKHFLNSAYITVPAVLLAVPRLLRGVRDRPVQLEAQHRAARPVHRGEPAAAAALLIPLFRMFTEIPLPAWMSDWSCCTTATGG
ncbi:hypothetical protein V2I01_24900 [Micromonospora sp. BRA006-A]|nr:hypothetical protein [Micromonospora sp. BRA006-A]